MERIAGTDRTLLENQSTRIPSLDGLRALAISLVLIAHFVPTVVDPSGIFAWVYRVVGNGALGVEIFFVISGFLITRLLMEERGRTGAISLRQFYVRRAFRILPAFYVFVAFVSVGWMLGKYPLKASDLISAATFVWNYNLHASGWVLAHTWSLSVEEQFYLLWPISLVILGNKKASKLAIALICLSPFLRVGTYAFIPAARGHVRFMLHARIDALMFGCITALLYDTAAFNRIYDGLCRRRIPLIAAAFAFLVSPHLEARFQGFYLHPLGYSLEGACIALMMVWLIRNAHSSIGRLFNMRPIRHIGVLSYSLYLWQQVFFNREQPSWITRFPASVILLLLCAHASYYIVERPFLALRQRFRKGPPKGGVQSNEAAATEAMPAI